MQVLVNINGKNELVKVSVYTEGERTAFVTITFNDEKKEFPVKATGGGDEYGYEFTAEDLIGFLSSEITF